MNSFTDIPTDELKDWKRVLRDAAILAHILEMTHGQNPEITYEQVTAELGKRFQGRWMPPALPI